MTAPGVLLAKEWTPAVDPAGWLMSEKLDGLRAYWTGSEFQSRNGNVFHAPAWFAACLPTYALDGELWVGRGRFQDAVSIVRGHDSGDRWESVRFLTFDAPDHPGAFEDRLAALPRTAWTCPIEQQICRGVDHLREELARVELRGGEGLMLRAPGSLYERKRSSTLLKVKTFHDAEATVVGHEPGKGKHAGRLGALVCTFQGATFGVGTGFTDADRENPPAIGSVITFSYQELTRDGVPRFPTFVRLAIQ